MSGYIVKTTYNVEGTYGQTEVKTLYCKHYNGCDQVCYYDEQGGCLFCVDDTLDNNMFDAIIKLYSPQKQHSAELEAGISYVNNEERKELGL